MMRTSNSQNKTCSPGNKKSVFSTALVPERSCMKQSMPWCWDKGLAQTKSLKEEQSILMLVLALDPVRIMKQEDKAECCVSWKSAVPVSELCAPWVNCVPGCLNLDRGQINFLSKQGIDLLTQDTHLEIRVPYSFLGVRITVVPPWQSLLFAADSFIQVFETNHCIHLTRNTPSNGTPECHIQSLDGTGCLIFSWDGNMDSQLKKCLMHPQLQNTLAYKTKSFIDIWQVRGFLFQV